MKKRRFFRWFQSFGAVFGGVFYLAGRIMTVFRGLNFPL